MTQCFPMNKCQLWSKKAALPIYFSTAFSPDLNQANLICSRISSKPQKFSQTFTQKRASICSLRNFHVFRGLFQKQGSFNLWHHLPMGKSIAIRIKLLKFF